MKKADLIIIGAGPGGYETAVKAAEAGLDTVIIEARRPGGTCLNEGCIPTKCLCRNAEMLYDLRDATTFGIDNLSYTFDISKAVERKNQVVGALVSGIESLLRNPRITYVNGKAEFVPGDAHTVRVDGEEYTAPAVIIATGSVTKYLPIEGAHQPGVLTSTEMLDLDHIPARVCIVGGGVIGLEFASIFNAFGSEVTVVEFCKEILPNFDSDIAKRLRQALKGRGITFVTQAGVTAIRQGEGDTYSVEYECKGKTSAVEADVVLMAVGRAANLDSLNLAEAGIEFDRRGIVTDEHFATNVPGVYAVGDINGRCQLAHAATFQSFHALNRILGREDGIRMDIIPAAVFTSPEAAMVGLTEQQCKEKGIECNVHKGFFRANGKAMAMNETEGMVKIISGSDGRVLGCHLFGPHAADLIQEITILMQKDGTVGDLRDCIHAHPTLSEVLMNAVG